MDTMEEKQNTVGLPIHLFCNWFVWILEQGTVFLVRRASQGRSHTCFYLLFRDWTLSMESKWGRCFVSQSTMCVQCLPGDKEAVPHTCSQRAAYLFSLPSPLRPLQPFKRLLGSRLSPQKQLQASVLVSRISLSASPLLAWRLLLSSLRLPSVSA